jgi:hypothetical protein
MHERVATGRALDILGNLVTLVIRLLCYINLL